MSKRVDLLAVEVLAEESGFRLERARFRYERYDGAMSGEIIRLNFERGDSVAGIVHLLEMDAVVLVEQFRYPACRKGHGWVLEIPAGMVTEQSGEDSVTALQREILEEIGFSVQNPELIGSFYPSVGASSERVHLYYIPVTGDQRVTAGGGCSEAGEDIRRIELPLDEALRRLDDGEIVDEKTIIGLQWLRSRQQQS